MPTHLAQAFRWDFSTRVCPAFTTVSMSCIGSNPHGPKGGLATEYKGLLFTLDTGSNKERTYLLSGIFHDAY